MPYNPNAPWTTAMQADPMRPIYVLRFDNLDLDFVTDNVPNGTNDQIISMSGLKVQGHKIDAATGTGTVGTASMDLVDVLNVVDVGGGLINTWPTFDILDAGRSRLYSGTPPAMLTLHNTRATLLGGYQGMDMADFATLFRGRLTEAKIGRNRAVVSLKLQDVISELINVDAFGEADSVEGGWTMKGHPVDLLYGLLTSDWSNANHPITGTLPEDGEEAGTIPVSEIDSANLQAVRDLWFPAHLWQFNFQAAESLEALVNEQFARVLGPLVLTTDGLVRLVPWRHTPSVAGGGTLHDLTDDDIVDIRYARLRPDLHLNRIVVEHDFDVDSNAYGAATQRQDIQDFADSGRLTRDEKIQHRGMHANREITGPGRIGILVQQMLRNRVLPALEMQVTVPFTRRDIQPGDTLTLHNIGDVPDPVYGERGLSPFDKGSPALRDRYGTVYEVTPDTKRGVNRLTIRMNRHRRIGLIGPNTLTTYGAQTDAERERYVWIADNGGAIGGSDTQAGKKLNFTTPTGETAGAAMFWQNVDETDTYPMSGAGMFAGWTTAPTTTVDRDSGASPFEQHDSYAEAGNGVGQEAVFRFSSGSLAMYSIEIIVGDPDASVIKPHVEANGIVFLDGTETIPAGEWRTVRKNVRGRMVAGVAGSVVDVQIGGFGEASGRSIINYLSAWLGAVEAFAIL